jgi:hypothetical protein
VLERLLLPAGLEQRLAETVVGIPGLGVELDALLEHEDGALELARLQKLIAHIVEVAFIPACCQGFRFWGPWRNRFGRGLSNRL